jgi:hypothetical protein
VTIKNLKIGNLENIERWFDVQQKTQQMKCLKYDGIVERIS